jgi:hypothetical protein
LKKQRGTEEVMKSQMMKKEEEVEKLEEEVVTLRVKIIKLNKNIEETETSTSSVENVEENPSRLLEKKNEEKSKSYAEVLKGRNHGQQESKKNEYNRDTSSTRPTTFRKQRSFNHDEEIHRREDHDQPRQEFRRTTQQRRSFTPRYVNLFYGHCFYCTNFGHKVADCRAYERNVQTRKAYVAPHDIECYKCHNYGHIAHDCRSMMDTSLRKNIDIRYKKVWKRKQEQVKEDQMNEGHPEVILSGLEIVRDEDKSTGKKKDVRYRKVWRRNEKQEEQVNKDQVPEITGFAVVRERKEEQVNKEQVQEIVLSGIVVQDQSTGRKEEVKVQKDDESTDEEEDYSASEQVFF